MIKRLFVALCLFVSFISLAQEGTASPYSFYGLGDFRFKGTAENRAMGGLSVLSDSIHVNLQNPAFYSQLKLTSLTLGATYGTTRLKTNDSDEKSRRTTLDYVAVGLPMGKFGAGFGLMPFTSVGYKLRTISADSTELRRYTGTGGLNKAFLGASYQFTKNFSVGAEFGYYFGKVETNSLVAIAQVQYGTRELNQSSGNGAGFTAGVAYNGNVGNKLIFTASAAYSPESTIQFSNERRLAVVEFLSSDAIRVIDEENVPVSDTKVKLPAKFNVGFGLGESKKWMVGTEVTFTQTENMTNRFADIGGSEFENAMKYTVGGYYIPNFTSFTSYAERVVYRAGLRYETTGLVLNGKSITDAGASVGAGFPVGGAFSNINLSLEYGKRGTRDAALVEENYFNISVGLSLNDRWFVKRKYD